MSRSITPVAGDHLDLSTSYPSGPPFTISAWIKRNALGTAHQVCSIGSSGDSNNRYSLSIQATDSVSAQEKDASTLSQATSSAVMTDLNWHLATAVFTSHSSRAAYLDGTNQGTNSAGPRTPAANNTIRVSGDPGGGNKFDGLIAHLAIWDIDLNSSEVLSLLTNEPRLVRPNDLIHYWPFCLNVSPELDFGTLGQPLIVTGTTYSASEPPPLNWIQEAGVLATILKGVAG